MSRYFEISHLTRYDYSLPVQLDEQLLRFLPLPVPTQQTLSYRLNITPTPVEILEETDRWGNRLQRVRFTGETSVLEISVELAVEIQTRDTGFQSAPQPLPPVYGNESASLNAYLSLLEEPARLDDFVAPLLAASGYDAWGYLGLLNEAIHAFYHQGIRLEGPPRTPAQTLQLREGVCRDLALLFMAACRQAGIAARFVSGYQKGSGQRQQRFLHAWAEACLPGRGWVGFDPTHNTVVDSEHVAIAAAPVPEATTPVEGGYRFIGAQLNSTLSTDIQIATRGQAESC